MKRRHPSRDTQIRLRVAQEAARIMVEQGIGDFLLAKRKAAERLQLHDNSVLPGNAEIEAALHEHQRLFHSTTHAIELHELRHAACRLMRLLRGFEPRLVGSVLSGVATAYDDIQLHVFVEQPEELAFRLLEHGINPTHAEKKLRYESDRVANYPSFKFQAGHQSVEIVAFNTDDLRQAPLSPVNGKPMTRADLKEVQDLLRVSQNEPAPLNTTGPAYS